MTWVSAAEAAARLGVSQQHVRRLAASGALTAHRFPGGWVVEEEDVRRRLEHRPSVGRPVGAAAAWAIVQQIDAVVDRHLLPPAEGPATRPPQLDRRSRYRLRQQLSDAPPVQQWPQWLRRRAGLSRVWAHPAALEKLLLDPRAHVGGARAALAYGTELATAVGARVYVAADDVDDLEHRYRWQHTASPTLELMVVPGNVSTALRKSTGPVPVAVALIDLLESDDAHERHVAAQLLAGTPERAAQRLAEP